MPKTGYLANLLATPPLIFKFQFHPEMLSEKKSFEYHDDVEFGRWAFDKTEAANSKAPKNLKGVATGIGGLFEDLSEFGSLLVATKAMRAATGKARTFALEFALDARPKPGDPGLTAGGEDVRRIEPDLAVLRSFMNPGIDLSRDLGAKNKDLWKAPPTCNLKLGDIELTCVMNDLNIKITKFKTNLTPERAEVSLTLSEQTRSLSTVMDVITRNIEVLKSYERLNAEDWLQQTPVVGSLKNAFD